MDRNTVIAFLLIAVILVVMQLLTPEPPPESTNPSTNDTTQLVSENKSNEVQPNGGNDSLSSQNKVRQNPLTSVFAQDSGVGETLRTIENDLLKLTFTNKGGRLFKIELKDYQTFDGQPVILLDGEENAFNYEFALGSYIFRSEDFFFELHQSTDSSLVYRLKGQGDQYVEQRYSFKDSEYMLDYDFSLHGFNNQMQNRADIHLNWQSGFIKQEKHAKSERDKTTVYYKDAIDESVNYLSWTDNDELDYREKLHWVAFRQQFFTTTLIADNGFNRCTMQIEKPAEIESGKEEDYTDPLKSASAEFIIEYKPEEHFNFPMQFYIGPNKYSTLKSKELMLEQQVYLGWAIFGWVNKWFIIPIFNFLNQFISNYGIIILLLTLFIKVLLFPLTRKSYLSFAKMNVLKPEIEQLKEKYGDDARRMQQEQMKLYSATGVNPLGGCLPQLLQFPILIAMYHFFPSALELRQEGFLWADDLSTYDVILNLPFNIPIYGSHVSGFTILSAVASLLYIQLNNRMTPTTNEQMKMIQYIMPVTLVFIFNSFSAGLTYYFFLSNIISFGQQMIIKRFFIDEDAIRKQLQENKKKPKKKSGFQKRLEEMMKEQEKQRRVQQKKKKR